MSDRHGGIMPAMAATATARFVALASIVTACGGVAVYEDQDSGGGTDGDGRGGAPPVGGNSETYEREAHVGFCRAVASYWEQRGPCSRDEQAHHDLDAFGTCMVEGQRAYLNGCVAEWHELWRCRSFEETRCHHTFGCERERRAYSEACSGPCSEDGVEGTHACGLCGDWTQPPEEWVCPCDAYGPDRPPHWACRDE